MQIETFYDPATYTLTYLVFDANSKDALVIDPVLDYNNAASKISTESLDKLETYIKDNKLNLQWVLETHAHADHLSSSQYIKERFPGVKVAIGKHITKVQEVFKGVFNFEDMATDGSQFDKLLDEGETLQVGPLEVKTIFTPGHTPACASYLIGDAVFTGDAIFMPDYGTGRCDFPAGCAEDLYDSIKNKLYELPDETRVFVGHDYQPGGREVKWQTTIGEEKKSNIHLKADTDKKDYVSFRNKRDATLDAPKILLPSVQFNIRAGNYPPAEGNGTVYFKFPVRK
jgi:glyoxylase-like metal-dependent hydrolase (beta-lactamase superfamily II)